MQMRYADSQSTHKKLLSVTSHQDSADQKRNEVSLHIQQDGCDQKREIVTSVDKGMEKVEPSYSDSGNVK